MRSRSKLAWRWLIAAGQASIALYFSIALEMIAMSWPLPGGTLILARAVSDVSDAPFFDEAAILLTLTQPTAPAFAEQTVPAGKHVPGLVVLMLLFYLGSAGALLACAWRRVRNRAPMRSPS